MPLELPPSLLFAVESSYVAQAEQELEILLPQPPQWWDYWCVLPHLVIVDCTTGNSLED
jgi:hypothetical protein